MRSYTTHERKASSRAKEPAIVYAAPYFAKENYTKLDKFSYARNGLAEIDTAGVLSVLPTSTIDAARLAIVNNAEVSATVLQSAEAFFAAKMQGTQGDLTAISVSTVSFGNGVYVAARGAGAFVLTSTDGVVWTQRTIPVSATWSRIAFGNNIFVLVSISSSSIYVTSSDGIVWTQRAMPTSTNWQVWFCNGLFIATGFSDTIRTSPDGIVWTARTIANTAHTYASVIYGGIYVAHTVNSILYYTSPDTITWTERSMPSRPTSGTWFTSAHGNDNYVAVVRVSSGSDVFAFSANGIDWTQSTLPLVGSWRSVLFSAETFMLIGDTGNIALTSKDGKHWTQHTIPVTTALHGLASNGTDFVAVGTQSISVKFSASATIRITETPTTLTLPANHSYFVKIT